MAEPVLPVPVSASRNEPVPWPQTVASVRLDVEQGSPDITGSSSRSTGFDQKEGSMPALTSAADVATRRLPKLFTPDAHRAADYLLAGSFIAAGAWFWRRNRRAALASWISGGSLLSLTLLTSYPGKNRRYLAFPFHGKVEIGMAAMVAAMPELLQFEDEEEKHFFAIKSGLLTVVSNLTAFSEKPPTLDR